MVARRRVYAIATDSAGCFHYRLRLPLEALDPAQFEIVWGPPDGAHKLGDVVIGQRIAGHNEAWLAMCEDPTLLAVYDMDDDLLNIDPANHVPHSIFAPQVDGTRANIAAADVVTVSTPHLAKLIEPINPAVVVLPNCVHPDSIAAAPRDPSLVTIGWAGSMFHAQDWAPWINDALHDIRGAYPRARIHMIGADYTGGLAHRVTGWSTLDHYWRSLDFDIGLGFLTDTLFNQSKSWIKALEYAARGAVPLMPTVGQYAELNAGLIYRDEAEFVDMLRMLIENDRVRRELARVALETAADWTIDAQVHRWAQVYDGTW